MVAIQITILLSKIGWAERNEEIISRARSLAVHAGNSSVWQGSSLANVSVWPKKQAVGFSDRPCLKGIKQRGIEENIRHLLWLPHAHKYVHVLTYMHHIYHI